MTYKVTVTREDGAWLADVPEVPGAHTFAHSLTGLKKSVREVIILMGGLADDVTVDLWFEYDVEDEVVRRAATTGHERRVLGERQADLRRATTEAVNDLTASGYSVRDAATLLEVTPGRISQLTNP